MNFTIDKEKTSKYATNFLQEKILEEPFSLKTVLKNSVFYPSSRFDGSPIRQLSKFFNSFIYTDYGVERKNLLDIMQREDAFKGYEVIKHSSIGKLELGFNTLLSCGLSFDEIGSGYGSWGLNWGLTANEIASLCSQKKYAKPFFCEWFILKRRDNFSFDHGLSSLSLLYMSVEGVDAYRRLYVQNKIVPSVIALIQPGWGFGGNWTDFFTTSDPLYRLVESNPAGFPEYLLKGGMGKGIDARKAWPNYKKCLGNYSYGGVGSVWLHKQ